MWDEDEIEEFLDDLELTKHKKSDTVKWILTLFGFILVGVMLAGIICGWFTPKSDDNVPEEQVESSFISPSSTDTISLYDVELTA